MCNLQAAVSVWTSFSPALSQHTQSAKIPGVCPAFRSYLNTRLSGASFLLKFERGPTNLRQQAIYCVGYRAVGVYRSNPLMLSVWDALQSRYFSTNKQTGTAGFRMWVLPGPTASEVKAKSPFPTSHCLERKRLRPLSQRDQSGPLELGHRS